MPTYRLTFNTMDVNQKPADRVMDGNYTLSQALSPFAEEPLVEVTANDFRTSLHGVTSFMIRFRAVDDETATYTGERAAREVSLPIDGIKVERLTRGGYKAVAA